MNSDLEDAVMDRRKKMSYMEIDGREKREVFGLAVVKRSMRHLQFSKILMSEEVLQTSRRFMEVRRRERKPHELVLLYKAHLLRNQRKTIIPHPNPFCDSLLSSQMGPNRGSILQIGYDSMQSCDSDTIPEKTYRDEKTFISPTLRLILDIIGHHSITFVLSVFGYISDVAYTLYHIHTHGANLVSITALVSTFLFAFVGVQIAIPELMAQKQNCHAYKWHMEEMYYSGFLYLQLKGLDVLASAQERMAAERSRYIEEGTSIRKMKEGFQAAAMREGKIDEERSDSQSYNTNRSPPRSSQL